MGGGLLTFVLKLLYEDFILSCLMVRKELKIYCQTMEKKTGKFGILNLCRFRKFTQATCILYQKRCNKFYHFQTCTPAKFLNIDPGFLEWGFKLIKGVRFLHFTSFFFNFSMKLTYLIPEWGLFKTPSKFRTEEKDYRICNRFNFIDFIRVL